MAQIIQSCYFVLVSLALLFLLPTAQSSTFKIVNKCSFTIWPGILSAAGGTPQISAAGASPLPPGQSTSFHVPVSWSGRLWGRTLCNQNPTTSKFSCLTGDCGSATPDCSGAGAVPPATLAEFTLNGAGGLDFYDVSLVDGFNLPMTITPQQGSGVKCNVTGCSTDLNKSCPKELIVTKNNNNNNNTTNTSTGANNDDNNIIACRSACDALKDPMYCCSGAYSTPDKCKPSSYSMYFKKACPTSYSYAYDDGTSTFTCVSSPDYVITFCSGTDPIAYPLIIPIIPSSQASASGSNRMTTGMVAAISMVVFAVAGVALDKVI